MAKAQQTIDWLFGQTEARCLEMFAKSIQHAHKCGSSKWGVTHYRKYRVRLNVGGIVVCTLHAGRIWFALDKDYQDSADYIFLSKYDGWIPSPRYDYTVIPSITGSYVPSTPRSHAALWRRIKRMHFSLIEKAADKYTKLREPSRKAHSRRFIEHLRDRLDPDLPDPTY